MRHFKSFTLLIGLILPVPATAFAGADEIKKLQGAWAAVSEIADGAEKPAAELRGVKLVFGADGAWRVEKDGKVVGSGGMTLGSAKTPKTVDYTFSSGELKGQQFNA